MKPTVLVTGGAGYIGSHTANLLSRQGYKVVIIDDLLQSQSWQADWADFIKSDFSDISTLQNVFEKYKPSAVMHFAAFIEVGESVADPLKFYKNNVAKTMVLLDLMLKHNVKNFIFSSSCAVYGNPQQLPLVETHPRAPVSPYGKTKLMVELMLEDMHKAYGLHYVSLRYFNAAGALPSEGLGERHNPESHIIPLLLRAAQNKKPFYIFGNNWPTPDGTCIRDYLHVLDLADAHCKALEYLVAGGQSRAFNLGTGTGYSVQEMIGAVEKIVGSKIEIKYADRREGDPPILVADNDEAKRILGWQPQHSDINSILKSAYEFEMVNK